MEVFVIDTTKVVYSNNDITIINDDIIKTDLIPDETIDLIVTSPPYNVDIKYGEFDDEITYHAYLEFSAKWLEKCYRLSKNDGRFCLNIPLDKNKGGQQSVCADITTIAKEVGWNYHSTIIWNEQNISRRTAWGSWMSASAPYVIAPVEVIVILYKENWKKNNRGESGVLRQEFLDWTNGVWSFPGESKKRIGHPAPFPLELPYRCITLFSYIGDTILDPFLGSGTTLVSCCQTKRKGIGVDMDKDYCELAVSRVENEGTINQPNLL
jgi:site-specific DNA-methyltransferase (adenine-specific)